MKKLYRNFDQTLPELLYRTSVVHVKISEWAQEVIDHPETIYPHVIFLPRFRVSEFAICRLEAGDVSPGTKVSDLPALQQDIQKYTFVIFDVTVFIRPDEINTSFKGNHGTSAFLWRARVSDKWEITFCDPNYSNIHTSPAEELNLQKLASSILDWADGVSPFLEQEVKWRESLGRVHIRQCVNVNRCVESEEEEEGICYLGICMNLLACAIMSDTKARDSVELIAKLLKASEEARSGQGTFIDSVLLGMPKEQIKEKLENKKRRRTSPSRPRSIDPSERERDRERERETRERETDERKREELRRRQDARKREFYRTPEQKKRMRKRETEGETEGEKQTHTLSEAETNQLYALNRPTTDENTLSIPRGPFSLGESPAESDTEPQSIPQSPFPSEETPTEQESSPTKIRRIN